MVSHSTSYVTKLLRNRFGKGPQSVKISMSKRSIVFQLRHFISPVEDFLLVHNEEETFRYTRELLMNAVLQDLSIFLQQELGLRVSDMYYDWDIQLTSGAIVALLEHDLNQRMPDYEGKQTLEQELANILELIQKRPEHMDSWWVDPSILCVQRQGISKLIEMELIELGHEDMLKTAKRRLEKRMLSENMDIQNHLGKRHKELYLDWNFQKDNGIILYTFS